MTTPCELLLCACLSTAAMAAEVVLPSPALERDRPVTAVFRTGSQATGRGTLAIRWTDVYGRVIEDKSLPVELADETEIPFPLDLRRAVAMQNTLRVRFSFEGANKKNQPDRREENAQADFVARPPERAWSDYHIIMWQHYPAAHWPLLKSLGIDAGQHLGREKAPPDFLFSNDLRWYAENIATDFYSEYHRWRPDREAEWSFREARKLYQEGRIREAFKRHPSLSDPAWLRKINDRLVQVARDHSPYRPLFYDLGDESGIADLEAAWDFDFSDQSLTEMRAWLKERYGTLAALNRQWGTDFQQWELVTPQTTDEAMQRADGNFSSWADHKEWMDISWSRALKMGADAVHSVDPSAYVGIAGGQMPGWGGYNYPLLTQAVNFFEPYDIGNNIEIIRSLAPATPLVTTSFAKGPWEKQRVWYELLHGNRGLIIWDDQNQFVKTDGALAERGLEAKPYYSELRGGIGALLINSRRETDPIAIHFSQASFRTTWMLQNQPEGNAWALRGARHERTESDFLRLRESYCKLVEDAGLQYNFVSSAQLEAGELARGGYRILILPDSRSLSAREARAIEDFIHQGGTVVSSGEPGAFDEHSRKLPASQLAPVSGSIQRIPGDVLNYHQARLLGKEGTVLEAARKLFATAGVSPAFAVTGADGAPLSGVETHRFRNGGVTILGLLTNPQLRVDELGPPEFKSNQRFEQPRKLRLALPREEYVFDIRRAEPLGRRKLIELTLDPYEPVLLAVASEPLSRLRVAAPKGLAPGGNVMIGLAMDSPAAVHVMGVDVIDPSGKAVPHYSGNLLAPNGRAAKLLPLAFNDPPGTWRVVVRDLLTGQSITREMEIH